MIDDLARNQSIANRPDVQNPEQVSSIIVPSYSPDNLTTNYVVTAEPPSRPTANAFETTPSRQRKPSVQCRGSRRDSRPRSRSQMAKSMNKSTSGHVLQYSGKKSTMSNDPWFLLTPSLFRLLHLLLFCYQLAGEV